MSYLLSTFWTEPLEIVVIPFLLEDCFILIIEDSEMSADAAPLRFALALDWADDESAGLLLADV